MTRSALLFGSLSHNRGGAVTNNFRYSIYSASLDLDELDELDDRCRVFSVERRNLFSLRGADYALEPGVTLRSKRAVDTRSLARRARDMLERSGSSPLPDRIELVTQLRVLGYLFNPVSFFLGYRDDRLVSVIAEINNTYDQTFAYVLDDRNRIESRDPAQVCFETSKQFFVSPFIGDDCSYQWTFPATASDSLDIRMILRRARDDRRFFAARLEGVRRPLDDRRLVQAFLRLPALPAQIISRIHIQALRLRWLGLQYRRPLPTPDR